MPLDSVSEELAKETCEALQLHAKDILREVHIAPERMKALRDAAGMRMTMNVNGLAIVVVESPDAALSIEDNIFLASRPEEPHPEPKQQVQFGELCKCGGQTVRRRSGEFWCVECGEIPRTNTPVSDRDAQRAAQLVLERAPVPPGSPAASRVQLASERYNGRG
jgi:hypothetical protein